MEQSELFKGYIGTVNGKPIQSITKKTKLKELDYASLYNEYAGILNSNIVAICFTDEEQLNKCLAFINDYKLNTYTIKLLKETILFFKIKEEEEEYFNKKGRYQLACGLVASIKAGANSNYIQLRTNDIDYEVISNSNIIELPHYLKPLSDNGVIKFVEDDDSDDDILDIITNYIKRLPSVITKEEAESTVNILNKYVLDTSIPNKLFNNTFNEEFIEKIFEEDIAKDFYDYKGKVIIEKFAKYLINKKHIIKINNNLHIYKDGIYINGKEWIEREMIKVCPNMLQHQRTELLNYLKLLVEEEPNTSLYDNYIAFRNGLYNIQKQELVPFSEDIIITNKINWNYDPSAKSPLIEKFLNSVSNNDKEIRNLIEEMIGYTFYRRNEMGKSFILLGPASNGKSTFQKIMQNLLGHGNIASIDLKDLGDRFRTAEIFGKLANIGDDISDAYIDDNNIFKTICTGGRVMAERKGQDPFEFEPYCKLIFSTNNMPKTRDRTGAVKRRLIIIPFEHIFKNTDPDFDPFISYKIINGDENYTADDNMSALINLGLQGLFSVIVNDGFSSCKKVDEKLDEYDKENNPIKSWYDDIGNVIAYINHRETTEVYNCYKQFVNDNGLKAMSNIEFCKTIKFDYNLDIKSTSYQGRSIRVFVPVKCDL